MFLVGDNLTAYRACTLSLRAASGRCSLLLEWRGNNYTEYLLVDGR